MCAIILETNGEIKYAIVNKISFCRHDRFFSLNIYRPNFNTKTKKNACWATC